MEANYREINSERDQTDSVSGVARDVVDYPDDEIENANRDANSEVHQMQPVSGIVRAVAQPLVPITREINNKRSQNGKLLCFDVNY